MDALQKHRAGVRRQIVLPMGLAIALLVVLVIALGVLVSGQQVGVVAGILATLFILFPAVVVLLVTAALFLYLAHLSGEGSPPGAGAPGTRQHLLSRTIYPNAANRAAGD
ncbi:MAG: hypothetical protein HC915_05255 [Anaerolineae bacterium]|nr:hypothetical protein [Anaerolineae bacterium]